MEPNGRGRIETFLVGLLAAAFGAAASTACSHGTTDRLRGDLDAALARVSALEQSGQSDGEDSPRWIRSLKTERIELVSSDGKSGGVLAADTQGASLTLSRADATVSLLVASGTSSLRLRGDDQSELHATAEAASATLELSAHGAEPRSRGVARLQTSGLGHGGSAFALESGRPWRAADVADDAKHPAGASAIRLDLVPYDGACKLSFADRNGRERLGAFVAESGAPRLHLLDAGGQTRLALGKGESASPPEATETAEDTIVSLGSDGAVKWRTPK